MYRGGLSSSFGLPHLRGQSLWYVSAAGETEEGSNTIARIHASAYLGHRGMPS